MSLVFYPLTTIKEFIIHEGKSIEKKAKRASVGNIEH